MENTVETRKFSVAKNGKLLMANKYTERTFGDVTKALNFVRNLIKVSNKLTLDDFKFIPCK
jgi:hypothetical protein